MSDPVKTSSATTAELPTQYPTPDADIKRALRVVPPPGNTVTITTDYFAPATATDAENGGFSPPASPAWLKISQCAYQARIPNFYDGQMGVYTRQFTLTCESAVTTSRGEPLATCRESYIVEDIHAFADEDRTLDVSNGPAVDDLSTVIRREGQCAKVE